MGSIEIKLVSCLEKVFPTVEPQLGLVKQVISGLKQETLSFQIAYKPDSLYSVEYTVDVESELSDYIRLRKVGYVPALYTYNRYAHDDDYITKEPGLFPDVLYDLAGQKVRPVPNQWEAIWVDVYLDESLKAGVYTISFSFVEAANMYSQSNLDNSGVVSVEIEVIDISLPKQSLIHTEWFHADCLADFYEVESLGDRHFEIIGNFIAAAVNRGINMILTPLFTVPLDTGVGLERTTVQLVDVFVRNGEFSFGFDKLERWVSLCKEKGVTYFEMSHLFTQWGANFTPKIMADVDGEYTKIFGWEVSSRSEDYISFLNCFMPQLIDKINELGIRDVTYFHISDEPSLQQLETYKAAKNLLAKHLEGFTIIDALSDFEFYRTGAVEKPVCATDHVKPFLENHVNGLWVYYCVGQGKGVSNRFVAMPSYRNRIIGVQLYKFDIEGFLHWGYNFYNTCLSVEHINPFFITDAGHTFPTGDPYLVYPGRNGKPLESIRMMVFAEALQDLRALQLLEQLTDKCFVMELIEKEGVSLTFDSYPKNPDYIEELREIVNREIKGRIK